MSIVVDRTDDTGDSHKPTVVSISVTSPGVIEDVVLYATPFTLLEAWDAELLLAAGTLGSEGINLVLALSTVDGAPISGAIGASETESQLIYFADVVPSERRMPDPGLPSTGPNGAFLVRPLHPPPIQISAPGGCSGTRAPVPWTGDPPVMLVSTAWIECP